MKWLTKKTLTKYGINPVENWMAILLIGLLVYLTIYKFLLTS